MTFKQMVLVGHPKLGKAELEDIDDWIDAWHKGEVEDISLSLS